MSIEISTQKCIGCSKCIDICPGTLLHLNDDGKAKIKYPQNCWGCASCVKECPVQAIALFLGEDIGGLGGRLTVQREDNLLHWTLKKVDNTERKITTDVQSANNY